MFRDAPADRSWFLQVNFVGPHSPWDVTDEMHGWYRDRDPDVAFPDLINPKGDLAAEHHQEIRRNYAAMVENIDRWTGRLLDVVTDRGERDETVVVFASDHGELLVDHAEWGKRPPYHPSVGVPFVVAGPGIESQGLIDVPATILDLHATFLDAAGVDPGPVDSRSMWPSLHGSGEPRDIVFSGMGHWRLAFDGRHKFVRGFDPAASDDDDAWNETAVRSSLRERDPLLFDRESDPDETENLVGERPDVRSRLESALAKLRPD